MFLCLLLVLWKANSWQHCNWTFKRELRIRVGPVLLAQLLRFYSLAKSIRNTILTLHSPWSKISLPTIKNQDLVHWVPGFRSSTRRCSVRKGFLRNFAKFTGKHLFRSLLFKKFALGLQLYEKRDSGTGVFLWILRNF